jgi:hypothetical protein
MAVSVNLPGGGGAGALVGGTDYVPLSEATWKQIATIAGVGLAPVYWDLGSEKDVTLSTGETVTMQIYGFDHDDRQAGNKARITFGCKNLLNTTRRMEATNINTNGYAGSEMGQWISNDLFAQLPADLRQVIKTVNKKTSAGNQSTTIVTNALKTFLFSGIETGLSSSALSTGEGATYPIFTNDASRIKQRSGTNTVWWLRSPDLTITAYFCIVSTTGALITCNSASSACGVSFGFCV